MSFFSMFNMFFSTPSVASCRHVHKTVQSYLDNELAEYEASRVGAHLKICKRCGLEASAYKSIKRSLHKRVAVDDDTVQRLRNFGASLTDDNDQ